MITFLDGKLVNALPTQAIVDVGGVGYEVFIPLSSYDKLPTVGQPIRIRSVLLHGRRTPLDTFAVVVAVSLSLLLVCVLLGAGGVGILLAMIRAHRGFADFDAGAARWGARHATTVSTHGLRWLTQLGGAVLLLLGYVVLGSRLTS